jgi:signal transduction histidine kinase
LTLSIYETGLPTVATVPHKPEIRCKYAQAEEIQIELVYEPASCCLRIKDNGRGFEADNTTLSRGFGLMGMTERAEHIGAQLAIESQLGQGTEVIVSVRWEAAA